MTNKQIAEAFANGATKGKSNTMFIDGDIIYSYGRHFEIAKRLAHNLYELTTKKYSVTTSRHTSHVRWALREHIVVTTPLQGGR